MTDDQNQEALRTPLGRERMLEDHELRIDDLDRRLTDMEQKEARRDKRWDLAVRSLLAIGTGIIIAVATLLIQSGGAP